jgi:hypothetical protein
MTSPRSATILACETVTKHCSVMLATGIHMNQVIFAEKLPLPPVDLHGIHETLQRAEAMLKNLELKTSKEKEWQRELAADRYDT